MRLFLTIALGIAFGVALIPVASKIISLLGAAGRAAPKLRHNRAVRVAALLLLLATVAAIAYSTYARSDPDQVSRVDTAAIALRYTTDSAVACSDSALLSQRNKADSDSKQVLADMYEPDRAKGDSAWLAWKRRKDERARPVSAYDYLIPRTCDDFRRGSRSSR